MKNQWMRKLLALVLALMFAVPAIALAEDEIVADEIVVDEIVEAETVDEPVADEEEVVEELPVEKETDEIIEEPIEIEDEFSDQEEAELSEVLETESAPEVVMESSEAADATLFAPAGSIPIDAAHFPDEGFRTYIKERYDKGDTYLTTWEGEPVSDGYLSPKEIEEAHEVYIRGFDGSAGSIASLQGVEYLSSLRGLIADYTNITSVDVSSLQNLEYVFFDFCKSLTSLNLGALPNLRAVSVIGCDNLASVDISQCPTLLGNIAGKEPQQVTGYWSNIGDVTYYEWGWSNKEESHDICYSANTRIITEASGSSASTPTNPTPAIQPIPVVKKNVKATAFVGAQYQINLNGAVAKSFKSLKKKVATVDQNGIITPKAKGKAKIVIKLGKKKKRTLTLTVKDPTIPTSVALNLSGLQTVQKGTSVTLTATLPAGTNSGIKWKSSNKKVATVKNGVVTFKKKGKVTITATAVRGKKKAKVKFKVTK